MCIASMPHALFVFNAFHFLLLLLVPFFTSSRIYVGFKALFFCSWLRSLLDTKMCSFFTAHFFSPSNVIGLFSFWFRLNDYNARWRHVWVTVFAIHAKCNNNQAENRWNILNRMWETENEKKLRQSEVETEKNDWNSNTNAQTPSTIVE